MKRSSSGVTAVSVRPRPMSATPGGLRLPAPLDVGIGPHDVTLDAWASHRDELTEEARQLRPEPACIVESPRTVPDPMPASAVAINLRDLRDAFLDLVFDPVLRVLRRIGAPPG